MTPPAPSSFDLVASLGLVCLSICFGSAFYFQELAFAWVGPSAAGAIRLIIAAIFLVAFSLATGHGLPKTRALWIWVSVIGIFGLQAPFILVPWAQSFVPTNVVAAYFSAIPLLILLFSKIFLGVQISRRKALGLGIGSIGLIILTGPGTLSQATSDVGFLPQMIMILVCVLLAGAAIVVRKMPKASPVQTTAAAMLVAGVASLPIAVATVPHEPPPATALVGLIVVGAVCTGIGNLLRYWLIRRKGPVFITPNAYLAALFAGVIGVVFLDEVIATATVVGLGVIVAGLLISQDGSGQMARS